MEESKELQGSYKIFRTVIYLSVVLEFFEYAISPEILDYCGDIVTDIHHRIKTWFIYNDGNLGWSKIATFLVVCITCIGTRNKKHLEFNFKTQVFYPVFLGVALMALSVWLFRYHWGMRIYTIQVNVWLYAIASVIGTVLVHIALDNISKFLKEGLMKDRFNFENESFKQCEECISNKYSVNIPMRYYYKGKFRKGWVNIVNPFRGIWRTHQVIFVKLTHWLKLNVNHLKSVLWVEKSKQYQRKAVGMKSGCLGTLLGNCLFCFPKFPKKTALSDVSKSTILFPSIGL